MAENTVLRLRKHADKTTGTRVVKYDPDTGEKKLVNPATPGDDHEAWPFAGVSFASENGEAGEPPAVTTISPDKISEGVSEGWASTEGGTPVVRPAGPTQADWNSGQTGQPHLFMHYDKVTFHTLDGDVTYRVTHQPDKYAADGDDETPVTEDVYADGATRVDHFYRLELEG